MTLIIPSLNALTSLMLRIDTILTKKLKNIYAVEINISFYIIIKSIYTQKHSSLPVLCRRKKYIILDFIIIQKKIKEFRLWVEKIPYILHQSGWIHSFTT